jgi:hypothetical protein
MSGGPGLDAREASAALRAGTLERLRAGFATLLESEASSRSWDTRDTMISLMPFVDCARRLGLDPVRTLVPLAAGSPPWLRETVEGFVGRTDLSLDAFGWTLMDGDDGPVYVFGASPGSG